METQVKAFKSTVVSAIETAKAQAQVAIALSERVKDVVSTDRSKRIIKSATLATMQVAMIALLTIAALATTLARAIEAKLPQKLKEPVVPTPAAEVKAVAPVVSKPQSVAKGRQNSKVAKVKVAAK